MKRTGSTFKNSIRFKFLIVMSGILLANTVMLSLVIAANEKAMLENSLATKGQTMAAFIAKLGKEPLLMKDSLQLDAIVNDANKDKDIVYAVIKDRQGNLLTSQFASINYRSPRLGAILSELPRESEFADIVAAIKINEPVTELATPVVIDFEPIGEVVIGMSGHKVRQQIIRTVLSVIFLNVIAALVLGIALFTASRKIILDPISELAGAASHLAKGRHPVMVDVKTSGEVQVLVDSFNQMLADLNKTTVSKDYVDSIIKSMTDAMIVISPGRKIELANTAACRLLGYDEKNLAGKPIGMLLGGGADGSSAIIDEIFSKGFVSNIETVCIGKGGAEVPVLFSGSAISGEGELNGIVCIAKDITEIKKFEEFRKMQEELLKVQKLESVGLLAGGIAHDFNNLLTAILGSISLVKAKSSPHDTIYNLMSNAELASLRARDLTHQLLTFSKGGAPISKTISIAELVVNSASLSLSGAKTTCEFSIPSDLWLVEADEGQMSQVINNLIINANHAMPDGGKINVTCENRVISKEDRLPMKSGRVVRISIEDNGIGIPEEYLGKIFDPYFSLKEHGSGLGLSVAYSILKNHDGYITVESKVGVGTKFTIYLPASESQSIAGDKGLQEILPGAGRILLMDDEEVVRNVAGHMLRHLGYEVEFSSDGAEAIMVYADSMASGRRFDAVIMDLTVPGGMGGKEAIESLRKVDPDIRAVVSSGYSNDLVMADFMTYGFAGAILKPYRIEELSEAIRNVFGRSKQSSGHSL